ncbi:MAG: hypothetical protein AB7G11_02475 [Phycisphaerales bacterium]
MTLRQFLHDTARFAVILVGLAAVGYGVTWAARGRVEWMTMCMVVAVVSGLAWIELADSEMRRERRKR